MDGIADMGGTDGWGRVNPPRPDEPVFEEPWQARAFGLALLSNRLAAGNLDSFRHALERLDPTAYLSDGYSGRWLNGAELVLTEAGVLAAGAVDARARNLRGERLDEPPQPVPVAPRGTPTSDGALRRVGTDPVFHTGQRVRSKNSSPTGHTRLARYVRGHVGTVVLIHPAFVFPDTNAEFRGENPQYVYTVRFDSRELWGAHAESFAVTVDLFESYLQEAE
jgi:nitrile hydratase subunit beta